MHMARVNVYITDELHQRAKRARLNVSALCQKAVLDELIRRERMRALERFNEELADVQGAATAREIAEADAWADEVVQAADKARSLRAKARAKARPAARRSA